LFEAAETLRQQAVEEWPALFLAELDDGLWTDEWHYRYEDYREWGCAFRDGWYLDDEGLNPTRIIPRPTETPAFASISTI